PLWYKQKHEQLKEVRNDFCNTLVSSLIGPIKEKYTDLKVLSYLRDVQKDIIEFPENFIHKDSGDNEHSIEGSHKNEALLRYEVNVIVSNHKEKHAPIVFERHPNYINLIG
ncbi:MAG TPA: AAA family ATPase, partial [Candidatus Berkiella sp.]|nr:AAA family ATPase [Candidatus Berkiella sp.]